MWGRLLLVGMLGLGGMPAAWASMPVVASASAVAGPDDPYAMPPEGPFARGGGSGPLVITYKNGRIVRVAPDMDEEGKQVYFAQIHIAPNRHSIGWLAEYDACAQDKPCPLALVVWHAGRPTVRFTAHGGVIESWQFLAGGREIAVQARAPDGTARYWLLATASGLSLAHWRAGEHMPPPPWLKFFTHAVRP
ncbi:hypothetical protein [Acidocella sp.]|uniref:hypothetical protein n=1 Tax=Acidocella sp. TaxID=50710 RepID=UPI003D08448F